MIKIEVHEFHKEKITPCSDLEEAQKVYDSLDSDDKTIVIDLDGGRGFMTYCHSQLPDDLTHQKKTKEALNGR